MVLGVKTTVVLAPTEIMEEEMLWRARVDGIVNKKIQKLSKEEKAQAIKKVSQKEAKGEK